ncbi:hypothetical protein AAG570_005160 [Ranatra chinensis]|uniref:Reverse transcriptase domain-containing protein n=1 Tax=Ranatra chinensis TaxID=642074 RepID=A0ABD0YCD8_9HEMI
MPVFDHGCVCMGDLKEWRPAAAQAGALLEAIDQSLPNAIRTSIYGVLLRRLSPAVQAGCGIEITTDLACVTRKLKEKYGGFRRPAEWSVVKLLKMRRADGESPSDFAHSADLALCLVKQLLDQGVIRKSISPYCSLLWVVPKPPDAQGNLRHRVVVDYKELNKHTRSEKYPLPRLEDMLDRMNGASVFSILDLKSVYHQIRMHEADCEKTAFQFETGNYKFTRMPFRLKNAPTTFQRLMDEFLEGLEKGTIQVFMDNIIVFSRSEQEPVGQKTQGVWSESF